MVAPLPPSLPSFAQTRLIDVRWDPVERVAEVTHPRPLELKRLTDVLMWRDEVQSQLSRVMEHAGGRFAVLVCIDNLSIQPRVAEEYSQTVALYVRRFATTVARYGRPNAVAQLIAIKAQTGGYRANLFPTRAEALEYLRSCR
jgi:hypothetical protein